MKYKDVLVNVSGLIHSQIFLTNYLMMFSFLWSKKERMQKKALRAARPLARRTSTQKPNFTQTHIIIDIGSQFAPFDNRKSIY
jgi:hypothetical protein